MVDRPIFLIGTGRSGSTALHRVLSNHSRVAWPSNILDRFPARTGLHRTAVACRDVTVLGEFVRKRVLPSEAYNFWDGLFPGFRKPSHDLTDSDVTPFLEGRVSRGLEQLTFGRRQRLLVKITGWPRIGFLKKIFPDARFVHLVRDGRAVANSLLKVPFWMGWRGPENWRWGSLPPIYEREWMDANRSYVVLAAIQWKLLLDALELQRETAGSGLLEIRYEDLCAAPSEILELICSHCELATDRRITAAAKRTGFFNANSKWKFDLDETQQKSLTESLATHLTKYGYSPAKE